MLILVTGASAGFGEAISERLVGDGHRVVGIARRGERLEAMRERLGPAFHPHVLDLADEAATLGLLESLPAEFRAVDVLVNNAGLALGLDKAQSAKVEDWRRMIDINVIALTLLTRAVLPGMVERNSGHVINIGSTAGSYPYPGGNVYGATKAYVRQFSLNLRADLAGTAVRVTNVEPGMVGGTEFSVVRFNGDADEARKRYEGVTALTAADIAETVSWVASQPRHVNVNTIELMPVAQSFGALQISRGL